MIIPNVYVFLGKFPSQHRENPLYSHYFLPNFAVENSEDRLHHSIKQAFFIRIALSLHREKISNVEQYKI